MFRNALLLLLVSFCSKTIGSLQGLYATRISGGVLQLVTINRETGEEHLVGNSSNLLQQWIPESCTPSALDETGKWYYLLATPRNNVSVRHIVAVSMGTGAVLDAYPLPKFFRASKTCELTLAADGGWGLYVTGLSSPSTLVTVRYNFTFRRSEGFDIILDFNVGNIELGSFKPVSTLVDSSPRCLWIGFQKGLLECDIDTKKCSRRALYLQENGAQFLSIQYNDIDYSVVGVMQVSESEFKVASISVADEQPKISYTAQPILGNVLEGPSMAAFAGESNNAGVLSKHVICVTKNGFLITAALNGTVVSKIHVCDEIKCPTSIGYEPFVF
eukprot:m.342491 g.342491  ORF g.342491 m.342491 type:complete len:330 (-) comp21444_c0_seq1:49-1038(-)